MKLPNNFSITSNVYKSLTGIQGNPFNVREKRAVLYLLYCNVLQPILRFVAFGACVLLPLDTDNGLYPVLPTWRDRRTRFSSSRELETF
jgi:hypothetical protein